MTGRGDTSAHLFEQLSAGDRRAFEHFLDHFAPRLLIYINYNIGERLRRKLDPTDILQNLYLRLLKDLESFRARARKRGVLKTLIRMADHEITEAYRYHFKAEKRSAKREITASILALDQGARLSCLSWVPSKATPVSQRMMRHEEYQRVMQLLSTLSPIEQYITVARVIEGLSSKEIADKLGKSRGAVQMIIARVRDSLRKRGGTN